MKRFCSLFIAILLLGGCYAAPTGLKRLPEEDGEVFLYVQALPGEAERFRFDISEIVAIREDGGKVPLSIKLRRFNADEMNRQRLIAVGIVPPGMYKGLAFRAGNAFLQGEDRENELLVPEEPVLAPASFEVRKGRAVVLEGALRPAEAIRGRFSFTPAFALVRPERPIAALMGYTVNSGSNDITVFNKKAGRVVDVIVTGADPRGIVLDQARQRAYVALSGEDAVDVIDVSSNEIIRRIMLSAGDKPQEPALTPDGRMLLTANNSSDTVSVIDPLSFNERERVRVGNGPNSVLIDRSGKRAYVFNTLSDSLSIIDLNSLQVTATLTVDAAPLRGQLNRQGDRLAVIHARSSYLTVIDTENLSVLQRISIGPGAGAIKIDTRTDRIYIGGRFDPFVSVYEPGVEMPIDRIAAGGAVAALEIDAEENDLYLVLPQENILRSLRLVGKETVSELDVGEGAYAVAVMGER
jgi:YVTN family beta-propeller protein